MGRKKKSSAPEPDESTSAAQPPSPSALSHRTAANEYLYNADLFGLNPKLDFRTRLILGCYVLDNIPGTLVRKAFANSHTYPRSAVEDLKRNVPVQEGGLATRSSSRHLKDDAARKIEDLGKRAGLMSSFDVILSAHRIIGDVLKKDQFAMQPLEEVARGTRARQSKKPPAADAPKHKRTIRMFTPADSRAVADSLAENTRYFDATHLFFCTECSKRFGG